MNDFSKMPDRARVWVYQSTRVFTTAESLEIKDRISDFVASWTAHEQQLLASGVLLHNMFVILAVDEKSAGASGCSIDKSMRFIKNLENDFGVTLTDRLRFAFEDGATIKSATKKEFQQLVVDGKVCGETIVFNNLVESKKSLDTEWQLPLRASWMASYFKVPV